MINIDNVKLILGITDTTYDSQLNYIIDLVTQKVLNYCNLETYPDGLNFTGEQMSAGLFNQTFSNADTNSQVGDVSSISRQSYSVSYNVDSIKKVQSNLNSAMNDYKADMNKFRVMK